MLRGYAEKWMSMTSSSIGEGIGGEISHVGAKEKSICHPSYAHPLTHTFPPRQNIQEYIAKRVSIW